MNKKDQNYRNRILDQAARDLNADDLDADDLGADDVSADGELFANDYDRDMNADDLNADGELNADECNADGEQLQYYANKQLTRIRRAPKRIVNRLKKAGAVLLSPKAAQNVIKSNAQANRNSPTGAPGGYGIGDGKTLKYTLTIPNGTPELDVILLGQACSTDSAREMIQAPGSPLVVNPFLMATTNGVTASDQSAPMPVVGYQIAGGKSATMIGLRLESQDLTGSIVGSINHYDGKAFTNTLKSVVPYEDVIDQNSFNDKALKANYRQTIGLTEFIVLRLSANAKGSAVTLKVSIYMQGAKMP